MRNHTCLLKACLSFSRNLSISRDLYRCSSSSGLTRSRNKYPNKSPQQDREQDNFDKAPSPAPPRLRLFTVAIFKMHHLSPSLSSLLIAANLHHHHQHFSFDYPFKLHNPNCSIHVVALLPRLIFFHIKAPTQLRLRSKQNNTISSSRTSKFEYLLLFHTFYHWHCSVAARFDTPLVVLVW